ncbi:MAG: hypothetical protein ACFFBC_03030 [Promethearchaeota archaeon]
MSVREVSEEAIELYRFLKKISKVNKKSSNVNINEEEIGKY